uniref:WW domain-containing adapter protein with coiled-coil n=1 Tax=Sinocyclocheilus anshuiensis TaxID=1608454 RepID=A0A671QRJ0_9TELE
LTVPLSLFLVLFCRCTDRRDSQPYQTLKYSSKSHPDHRHEKMRDSNDATPPCKMLRRSDSPENNHKSEADTDPADDWSEHISSSGKKYYYNCRTEVSQWEKPKEWLEREQRQKEATKMAAVVNSFPKDRDYRREAMQATPTSFSSTSKYQTGKPLQKPSSLTPSSSSAAVSGLSVANSASGASGSTVPVSPVMQLPAPPTLLQDPSLLRQLLPALQTALQLNNASVDMAKINEGKCTESQRMEMIMNR